MKNLKAIIFDLDGTLIHSAPDMHAAVNVTLNTLGRDALDLSTIISFIGNGFEKLVEQKLQRSHIGRLREGLADSIETSNIHQETLRALKQINTAFAQVGYPILHKSGDLLKSRLT